MASDGQVPRMAGLSLKAAAAAATTPLIGRVVVQTAVKNLGLDALDDIPELKDASIPPATMPRIRKAGAR